MGARCVTSVWIGYHVAELAVIRLGGRTEGGGGGARGAVAPPKLLASGNHGDGQDWLGNRVTSTIPIIFRCHSDSLSGEILVVATYIPTLQAVPTCIQKSCTIPTSLNAGCLRSGTGSDS